MPELPEVETVCRGLNQVTSGLVIKNSEILLSRTLAYPETDDRFTSQIEGQKIIKWHRRGKYLLAQLSKGWLGVHLRMTGQLLWVNSDSELHKHTRVRLFFAQEQELRFVDTRTFGKFWLVEHKRPIEEVITGLQKLGVEPFSPEFTTEYFLQRLGKSRRQIKTILLDQNLVAGVGNIYADESLFKAGIHPTTISRDITPEQGDKLRQAIIDVLQKSIEAGGTTFSDFLQITGVNGNYGGMALVYGRKDQPCHVCGTKIEKIKIGGRSSHFCPQCQKLS